MVQAQVCYLRQIRNDAGELIGVQNVSRSLDLGDDEIADVRSFYVRYDWDPEHPKEYTPHPAPIIGW